jgi:hypothetical protein
VRDRAAAAQFTVRLPLACFAAGADAQAPTPPRRAPPDAGSWWPKTVRTPRR